MTLLALRVVVIHGTFLPLRLWPCPAGQSTEYCAESITNTNSSMAFSVIIKARSYRLLRSLATVVMTAYTLHFLYSKAVMVVRTSSRSNTADINPETEHDRTKWSGIIGVGQSLAVGVCAPLFERTSPVQAGLRLEDRNDIYDIELPHAASLSIVQLTEPFRKFVQGPQTYPNNIDGKTPHSSMAMQISAMSMQKTKQIFTTMHSNVGVSGAPMWDICKNGNVNSYAASMFEAQALTRLAKESGHNLEYDCILLTHGEADAILSHTSYAEELVKMLRDYTEDLRHITGQAHAPIMILSQQQSSPPVPNVGSAVIQAQWFVQAESSNTIICAGPKYQYSYVEGALHLSEGGYNRLGEKYGQVFYQTVIEKNPFIPLSPNKITLKGPTTILVSFNIPVGPLAWNEALATPHQTVHTAWSLGRGFEVRDAQKNEINITNVRILSNDELEIDLAPPIDLPLTLSYAMTIGRHDLGRSTSGIDLGGSTSGRIGQLCDSDPLVGVGAETLECEVVNGSREIFNKEGFKRRTLYDRIIPGNLAIIKFDKERPQRAVLHQPWLGSSGSQKLFFQHDHRNHLVSFTMPVVESSHRRLVFARLPATTPDGLEDERLP